MASIRITKTMAENAAKVMSEKAFGKKINEADKKKNELIEALVIKYIPAPVIACEKEFKELFFTTCHVCVYMIKETEYGAARSSYINGIISFNIATSHDDICVNEKDYNKLNELSVKLSSLQEEKRNFEDKVYSALLALRTINNVESDFPEALQFIDVPTEKKLPSPILSDIRNIVRLIK